MSAFARFSAQLAIASAVLAAFAASPAAAQVPAPAAAPPLTAAQTAFLGASFAQVAQGREVWITTTSGPRLKAKVIGTVATGLNVSDKHGQKQTIRFEEINMVQKATHRVRTHTFIGLGVGGGLGLLGLAFCAGEGDEDGVCASFVLTYALIGTGIGALNGAIQNNLNRDDDLIYKAGARTTITKAIAPILTRTRKGVAFTMSWR